MPIPHTMLVVDDDAPTRQLLRKLLETEEGYRVLFAENGTEALELAASACETRRSQRGICAQRMPKNA